MKVTQQFVSTLKNFSLINNSIIIQPGTTVETIAITNNISGRAEMDESIDGDMCIYDLAQFISTLSLFENPVIEFPTEPENVGKFVSIKEQDAKTNVRFYMTSSEFVHGVDSDITMPACEIDFELSEEVLAKAMKAAATLGVKDLSFVSDGADIKMVIKDSENKSSNVFSVAVGESDGTKFCMNYKVDHLKLIPGSYNVSISKHLISCFKNVSRELLYYVALEDTSTYG